MKAVVIGAGFGGIAAAIRLRAKGYEVEVVESGDQAGGRARVFTRAGHRFDAGPTVITAPHLFDELFELFGKDARDYYALTPVDPFYRVVDHDRRAFDYVGDDERLFEQIAKFNSADVDGYQKLLRHSQKIFEVGFTQLIDADFSNPSTMLSIVPSLVRLRAYKSLYSLVSQYIRDPFLRQVFTFEPLLIGGNPFRVPGIYLLIHWLEKKWGVHYAMGGTGSIVQGLLRLLAEQDVPVHLNAPVAEIATRGGRARGVVLENGEYIAADVVVSNADPATVYTSLLPQRGRRKHTARSIERKRYSMSLFVGYFGSDRVYPDVPHHTILLGPRYRELLTDIFDRKRLAHDFSLYLHAPTRTDPSLGPPGSDTFYVLSPVPNLGGDTDWNREGARYMDRILTSLERYPLPGLRESLTTQFFVTPRYFQDELRSYRGAAFGPEPTLRQSAYFRFHNRSDDVRGLYFVGAGVHPGAGLPGVLSSAKATAKMLPDRPWSSFVKVAAE